MDGARKTLRCSEFATRWRSTEVDWILCYRHKVSSLNEKGISLQTLKLSCDNQEYNLLQQSTTAYTLPKYQGRTVV